MLEIQNKIKRQLEILGICLDCDRKYLKNIPDLAFFFNVEEITIKRDLNDLRALGFNIHSYKKKGVIAESITDYDFLKKLILYYSGLTVSVNNPDKSTTFLVRNKSSLSFSDFVKLQIAIEKNVRVKLLYRKDATAGNPKVLSPISLFHSRDSWRLLAKEEDTIKQFHLEKIYNVDITENTFAPIPEEEIEHLFKHSFGSWLSNTNIPVKIHLSDELAKRYKGRLLAIDQRIEKQEDGSVLFYATVNNIDEFAGWVVTLGKGCKVIEPELLRGKVIEIAQSVLSNY